MTATIDVFVADMQAQGRFNSPKTEIAYRATLGLHAQDVENRDPRYTGREDVKRTLARWRHPNTQGTKRAHLVSFYRWMVEEGLRPHNPAEQTRRPKRRKSQVYRLTREEAARFLTAASIRRERWLAFPGVCAGLRRQEIRGLQGRHFRRVDFLWVSSDIGKGGRERWVPLIADLRPIANEIREQVADDEYVIPAQRWRDPGYNRVRGDLLKRPASEQAVWNLCLRIGRRAGIPVPVTPHMMRHAFADHIARFAGVQRAQAMLGHADIGTTQDYIGAPTLDDLAASVEGFTFLAETRTDVLGSQGVSANPHAAMTRTEPVVTASRILERLFASPMLREAARGMV